ncbi:hypothetical protein D3C86_1421410 [compost metagenome]
MNGDAAFTRSRPAGRWRRSAICSSARSAAARIWRAWASIAAPSSVNSSRRVVRRSSVVSSFSSSRDSARLTPETVWSSCSAAAVIEPLSTTVAKASNSSSVSFILEF